MSHFDPGPSGLDKLLFPRFVNMSDLLTTDPRSQDPIELVREQALVTWAELEMLPVPARDLDVRQQFAILFLVGLMRWDAGQKQFVSTSAVGIADRPGGGYYVGSSPDDVYEVTPQPQWRSRFS